MATAGMDLALLLSSASLALTALATLPSLFAIVSQVRRAAPKDNFYQDADGHSTPESLAAFSNRLPKLALVLLSILGFAAAVTISVLATLHNVAKNLQLCQSWLLTASWAAMTLQAVFISAHHDPVESHDLGLWLFLSGIITAPPAILQSPLRSEPTNSSTDIFLVLHITSAATLLLLIIASVSIPRRPHVFFKGHQVDAEWTVSAISRYTWSWVAPLLRTARSKGDLDEKDIPGPDHLNRAAYLASTWNATTHRNSLLRALCRAYGGRIALQWSVTMVRCILGIGPFWTMLRLVQSLENRDSITVPRTELWFLIFCLAFFTLTEQWIDGWIIWYSVTRLCIPIRGQLSALVFEKSLRRKNVKAAEREREEQKPCHDAQSLSSASLTEDDGLHTADPNNEASVLSSRQAIVNLVGVDSRHISDFAMMQYFIINSVGKLLIFSAFLVQLIGWIPFGAGILAWALVLPINAYVSKFYMKSEDVLMQKRDHKLAIVNEALLGIRQIKFSALEAQWERRILEMREQELRSIKRVFAADTVLFFCWVASPILLAAASLAVYAVVHGSLSPSVAFVSVGIFKSLEVSLASLPELMAGAMDTVVSIRRIEAYLKGPEKQKNLSEGSDVTFRNATIAWPIDYVVPEKDRFILRNVNLSFPVGELSVISGKTGTGKSLLLNAILGEVDLLHGSIVVPRQSPAAERNDGKAHPGNWILPGAVAYVGQTPWLESASFRDNILFGLPYFEDRYSRVLEVCALKKDLEILADGDKTELGANGINLSGGQKWRVSLARAVYSRAAILVMDDIFSAVDAHVGRQIFDKCVSGDICQGRTRILVTHHVALVQSRAKYLVDLGDNTILQSTSGTGFVESGPFGGTNLPSQIAYEHLMAEIVDGVTAVNSESTTMSELSQGDDHVGVVKTMPAPTARKFVEEESREKGMVKRHVYATLMKSSGGWFFWTICVILFVAFEAGNLGRGWWLRIWTSDGGSPPSSSAGAAEKHGLAYGMSLQHSTLHAAASTRNNVGEGHHGLSYYLWIYVALATASGIIGTMRFLWSFAMSIQASRTLFKRLLFTVLRTKLRWLDTVPLGRILNRLTADFDIIDSRITMDMALLFWRVLGLLGVCVAAFLVSAYIIPLAVILVFAAAAIGKQFLDGARPVKRLESNAKSPVFELFNAALSGVSTLRAFQKTQEYTERMYCYLDTWDSLSVYTWTLNRWLGFRMALVGTIFTTVVGAIVVGSSYVDAAMAGFTLSFALDFSGNMLMAIRGYASLELDMNAAERVIEFAELETEAMDGEEPPAAWPTSGCMEVKNLVAGYADDLPPVLNNVSFSVSKRERIGVIGRTGAGKSSLTLALFRFLEARSGKVMIDGIDISKITLDSLRSRLAIIPQDPFLFSGTIRSNLDPFDNYTDEELIDCLTRVHLVDAGSVVPDSSLEQALAARNINIFGDLSSAISESGGNLSQGQRQLLCMARAIISRPKIMVLDEATSAVDMATDALIQRSIREEFTDSTLIVIAHRLSTIADFDRILVLSEGRVAEFGTPGELWEKEGGIFREMCEHSGERDKLRQIILHRWR